MNDLPRQILRRIVAKYGSDLGGKAKRCESLLKDYCGAYRREINVLTNAVDERIPLDLLAAGNSMPRELFLTRLAKRLEDNLGLTGDAARWAVDSWALALGVITENELRINEKDDVKPITPLEQNLPPQNFQNPSPNRNQPQPVPRQPPATAGRASSVSPPTYAPRTRNSTNFPAAAHPQPVQKINSNHPVSPSATLPNAPANLPAPKRYVRKFFGCLFVIFLLIVSGVVLMFGVPYAISVMRETQQQNEPPRFPGR